MRNILRYFFPPGRSRISPLVPPNNQLLRFRGGLERPDELFPPLNESRESQKGFRRVRGEFSGMATLRKETGSQSLVSPDGRTITSLCKRSQGRKFYGRASLDLRVRFWADLLR
jgi:hypothetical protein